MTDEQQIHLRALLRAKIKRPQRLQEMRGLLGDEAVIALVMDSAEKHGVERAIDRYRLPLLAATALIEGTPYVPPVITLCGAKTRKGTTCKRKPIHGKKRCRNHGGLSTGSKTIDGRKQQGSGLRAWHAARRAAKASETR
ncbi:MAG: HGGxSTG domain-containing protein [Rugosibacter sp.]|nr:HGGxSTG domain-containing protein [Rugosibacter sp.]